MNKILLALVILLGIPYLFLATSVEEVNLSIRSFNCFVGTQGQSSQLAVLGSVYYDPIKAFTSNNKRIILPYFFTSGELLYADCGKESFSIGYRGGMDWIKAGDLIHVFTELKSIKFFSKELSKEEGIVQFGTGWQGDKLGETVVTVLQNGKEIKMFNRQPVKE